jgi:oxygen-dependent protoporphyrinogen oxidase
VKRLVIIGGGISGLAAARTACEAADRVPGGLEVLVLEREAEVGGKAISVRSGDWLVETGPTGYLDNEPAFDELIRGIGLEKLPAREAAAHRFLVRGGRMREIQPHPVKFLRSGILGPAGILRMLAEPWVPRRNDGDDETIWRFAERRLGRQAADRMIAPMVLGVFAGDARRLSLPACFPRMAQLERDHGSLIRAMIALRKERKRSGKASGGPAGPAGRLTSFREGMQALPIRLAERSGATIRRNATVEAILRNPYGENRAQHVGEHHGNAGGARDTGSRIAASAEPSVPLPSPDEPDHRMHEADSIDNGTHAAGDAGHGGRIPGEAGYRVYVHGDAEPIPADAVLLATESWAAGSMIETIAPELSRLLLEIPYPPVAVIACGFGPGALDKVPRGFGVLIPRGESYRMLGCLWDTHLFPGRGPENHLLLRVMLGGAVDTAIGALSESELLRMTREELRRLFGIEETPIFEKIVVWPRAIPQYELGHLRRVAAIDRELDRLPGLYLAGNALRGISFSRSAVTGIEQGHRAVGWLSGTPRPTPAIR